MERIHSSTERRLGISSIIGPSLVVTLLLSACGSADDTTTTTTQPETSSTTSVAEPGFSIVVDESYVGVKFYDETAEPYNAYPEFDGWLSVGPGPTGNEYGGMMVYRRSGETGREDLVVMWERPGNVGVHGLRLTGDTSEAHLILSCQAEAVLLIPDSSYTRPDRRVSEALRAWRPGPSGMLEEFDPATGDSMGSC